MAKNLALLACQFLASNMWSTTYFPISCRGLVTKIALLQYSIEDMLLKLKNHNIWHKSWHANNENTVVLGWM